MPQQKNILICPLDWGLGHATRCIPIIRMFLEKKANVIIAASGRPLALLKKEFPGLTFIDFPGYTIRYPKNGSMAMAMFRSSASIIKAIRKENETLEKIISENKIDIVISDNRFGLHTKNAYCIYMTHQVMIKCPPALEFLLYRKHLSYISRYNECWIPDFKEDEGLSGILSHKYSAHKNTFFIGPLSRFAPIKVNENNPAPLYDVIVILSGPEPQRSILEEIIVRQAVPMKHLKFLIVSGITETVSDRNIHQNIRIVSHLETEAMRKAITGSKLVICRPGYSSIMDLVQLNKKAVFIPTPGQTEQEYLAKLYLKKNLFYSMCQKDFKLDEAIQNSASYPGYTKTADYSLLESRIENLLP